MYELEVCILHEVCIFATNASYFLQFNQRVIFFQLNKEYNEENWIVVVSYNYVRDDILSPHSLTL